MSAVAKFNNYRYRELAQEFWDMVQTYIEAGYTKDESIQSASLYISVQLEKQGIAIKDFNDAVKAEAERRGYTE